MVVWSWRLRTWPANTTLNSVSTRHLRRRTILQWWSSGSKSIMMYTCLINTLLVFISSDRGAWMCNHSVHSCTDMHYPLHYIAMRVLHNHWWWTRCRRLNAPISLPPSGGVCSPCPGGSRSWGPSSGSCAPVSWPAGWPATSAYGRESSPLERSVQHESILLILLLILMRLSLLVSWCCEVGDGAS